MKLYGQKIFIKIIYNSQNLINQEKVISLKLDDGGQSYTQDKMEHDEELKRRISFIKDFSMENVRKRDFLQNLFGFFDQSSKINEDEPLFYQDN